MGQNAVTVIFTGLCSVLAACEGESRTSIAPGDTFMLGGEQQAPFLVRGQNVGASDVEILANSGAVEQIIVIAKPGDAIEHRFAAGEIAMFRNRSSVQNATVRVVITSEIDGLSMRYKSAQSESAGR
jgi:hypothetical protein